MSTVTDHAEELCAYLNSNILGEELRLTHLLDALASCGLTLAPGRTGVKPFSAQQDDSDRLRVTPVCM